MIATVMLVFGNKSLQENKTKIKILYSLAVNQPDGESTSELAKDTGLHRDTIHTLCEDLKREGLVVKKGKFANYKITINAFDYPSLSGFVFGNKVIGQIIGSKKIIGNERRWICEYSKFCNNELCRKLNMHEKFCDDHLHRSIIDGTKDQKSLNGHEIKMLEEHEEMVNTQLDELDLFEFANRIGAVITYTMIQALRSTRLIHKSPGPAGDKNHQIALTGIEIDNRARMWVNNAIKPQSILSEFAKQYIIKRGLKGSFKDPGGSSWSFYDLDEINFKKLTATFENAFPEYFKELEEIREEMPEEIGWHNKMMKELLMKEKMLKKNDPDHTKCKGKLSEQIFTNKEERSNNVLNVIVGYL